MFAKSFLPWGDGGDAPHVGHLRVAVHSLHQLIVEVVRHLLALSRPNHELGAEREVSARNVWRWIGLLPGDYVEDFVAKLGEVVGDAENVVVGAAYPNRAVVFQHAPSRREPLAVEIVVGLAPT